MIESSGRLCQLLGMPRTTGQIYGLLYLSPRPLSLDDIVSALSISKASASTGTRHLTSLRVARQVWIPGERRDYYEAEPDVGGLLRVGYAEFVKPRLNTSTKRLKQMSASLEEDFAQGTITEEDYTLCNDRLRSIVKAQEKLQTLAPMAEQFL